MRILPNCVRQLCESSIRILSYSLLEEALSYYTDQGWMVFPWVVGICGMIYLSHIESLLKFLRVQQKHWRAVVKPTVLVSVLAFHFLHTVRSGGLPEAVQPDLDPERGSDSASDDGVEEVRIKRKSRRSRAVLVRVVTVRPRTALTQTRRKQMLLWRSIGSLG